MPFQVKVEREEDAKSLSREDTAKAMNERSEQLHTIFEEAGPDMDPMKVKVIDVKDGQDLATQIRNRNNELGWIGARQREFDEADAIKAENEKRRSAPAGADPKDWAPRSDPSKPAPKSFGKLFTESALYEAAKNKQNGNAMLAADASQFLNPRNTTFATGAGWAPETLRTGRVVLDEQREIEVTDILPVFPTTQAAIVYMEETTFTNAAAERVESTGAYAEATLALTERSVTVRSIGVSIPVTDEQLADVEGVEAYLNQRLSFMVRQRLDTQVLTGDGIAPNLLGTISVGSINTQALGTDNRPDAIYKGIKAARITGRSQPNVVVLHPNDWEPIRLLKTTDGVYIYGAPSDAGPKQIWGLPVIESTAVTENTGITGDYARFAGLHMRQGMDVQVGYVNDDFLDGRVTIRAGIRCAIVHYRPAAFTQITGL